MSDHFIVSARKYRPQHFNSVIGQSHITTTLKNAITQQQLAHAFLFCGPRGVGKTTCARILAKTINCQKRTKEGEACDKCESCISFEKGTSFSIHELDAASNNGVDEMRGLVEQIRYAPQPGQYKVYIIDEVHMLSTGAFNAFLKTLEEPPPYAIFILATTEKHKILPTILSRCQIFDFKRITTADTVEHLQAIAKKEKIKAEPAALHVIAEKSEGCLRDALSILDKIVSFTEGDLTYTNTLEHLNILDESYYFRLLECMLQQQVAEAMLLYNEIHHRGFEGEMLLDGFAEFVRNLLVCKDEKSAALLLVPEDFKTGYTEQATKTDTGWLLTALNIVSDNILQHRLARNKKLHIELWLIKMCMLNQALQVTAGNGSKKKLTEAFRAVSFIPLPSAIPKSKSVSSATKAVETVSEPVLMIEKPEKQATPSGTQTSSSSSAPEPNKPASVSLSSLQKIRQQVSGNIVVQESKVLEPNLLKQAWESYTQLLKTQNNLPAVTAFQMANLEILEPVLFEVITENKLHYKFFENERVSLIRHMQTLFSNPAIRFQLRLDINEVIESNQTNNLTQKALFEAMIKEYPQLKNLKERLKLDLGF